MSLTQAVIAVLLLLIAAVWAGIFLHVGNERVRTLQGAIAHAQNIARASAEHTERIFRSIDQFTWTVKQIHEAGHLDFDFARLLRSSALLGDIVIQANIIDARGHYTVLHNMGVVAEVEAPDRGPFWFHQRVRANDLLISRPRFDRATGRWSILATRRLNDADGSFTGVVTVSIDPAYFGPFYQSLTVSPRDSFSILGTDGAFRVRYPFDDTALEALLGPDHPIRRRIGTGESVGAYQRSSIIDGVERIFAFAQVRNYPLIVTVGRPVDDIAAQVDASASRYVKSAMVFSGLMLVLGGIVIKVSARERKTRARLVQALKCAELASQSKSEFLARMSHELRTPLNAVLGYSEAMSMGIAGAVTERGREYLDHIYLAGRQLLDHVNDILDIARLEAGKVAINEEILEVAPLLRQAVEMCRPAADKKSLNVAVVPAECGLSLRADRRAVTQMLLNLVTNAIKFTEQGCVSIQAVRSKGWLVLTVRDTGVGIAAADIDRVTSAFERAGNVVTSRHEGVGLGLAIVKHLVELHQGELRLESTPGQGTSALLRFPPARVTCLTLPAARAA